MAVGWPLASTVAGRLLPRLGYRRLLLGGLSTSALAGAALALLLRPGASVLGPQALTFAYGVGLGLANTPLIIAVQTSVPWNRRGVATASDDVLPHHRRHAVGGRPRRRARRRSRPGGRRARDRGAAAGRGARDARPGARSLRWAPPCRAPWRMVFWSGAGIAATRAPRRDARSTAGAPEAPAAARSRAGSARADASRLTFERRARRASPPRARARDRRGGRRRSRCPRRRGSARPRSRAPRASPSAPTRAS